MCESIIEPAPTVDYLDIGFKCATICIALFNAFFAVKIFWLKTEKDDNEKERDRKIQLLKTLILDHNLKYYYSIFDEIDTELDKLKQDGLSDAQKGEIDSNIGSLFIKLRRKFYDSLLAIDKQLYETIKGHADELQTHLTNNIFDQGINLSHMPKFDELISEKVTVTKTEITRILFGYRG